MSVTHEDFLKLAERLIGGSSEIELRNCISRGYYASYHNLKSVEHLRPDNSAQFRPVGMHMRLINRFKRSDKSLPHSMQARRIGYLLAQMKQMRAKADYELEEAVNLTEAQAVIQNAKILDSEIKKFYWVYGITCRNV